MLSNGRNGDCAVLSGALPTILRSESTTAKHHQIEAEGANMKFGVQQRGERAKRGRGEGGKVLAWERLCALCAVSLCTGVLVGENDRDAQILLGAAGIQEGSGRRKARGSHKSIR